ADQRQAEARVFETRPCHVDDVTVPSPAASLDVDLTAEAPNRRSGPLGMVLHDLKSDALATSDHMVSGFDDRCLFVGDLLDRVAQILLVVVADVRDHGDTEGEG